MEEVNYVYHETRINRGKIQEADTSELGADWQARDLALAGVLETVSRLFGMVGFPGVRSLSATDGVRFVRVAREGEGVRVVFGMVPGRPPESGEDCP